MDTESVVIKAFVHELGHARFALLPEKQQEEFFSISHSKENKWANTK